MFYFMVYVGVSKYRAAIDRDMMLLLYMLFHIVLVCNSEAWIDSKKRNKIIIQVANEQLSATVNLIAACRLIGSSCNGYT